MHETFGRYQKQAASLMRDHLEQLLSNCSDNPKGLHNRVLPQLDYETMRRRSELCTLKFEDVDLGNDLKPILCLQKSQGNEEAIGWLFSISRELGNLIETWRKNLR